MNNRRACPAEVHFIFIHYLSTNFAKYSKIFRLTIKGWRAALRRRSANRLLGEVKTRFFAIIHKTILLLQKPI
jgi:hypothetical protein